MPDSSEEKEERKIVSISEGRRPRERALLARLDRTLHLGLFESDPAVVAAVSLAFDPVDALNRALRNLPVPPEASDSNTVEII